MLSEGIHVNSFMAEVIGVAENERTTVIFSMYCNVEYAYYLNRRTCKELYTARNELKTSLR